jgi:hypothetical protein
MYRLLIALMLFATVSHGLPTNATTRTATEGYVTNSVAQGLAAHSTNATAHAALLAGKLDTNATITINGTTKPLTDDPSFTIEVESGITAPEGTNIAQAVSSAYLPLSGGTMTGTITMGANVVDGNRFGEGAGANASGSFFSCLGVYTGLNAIGDEWTAVGVNSALNAKGNNWGAFGYLCGVSSIWTNSHAFGHNAGYKARGSN